jgi:hypothetical protein
MPMGDIRSSEGHREKFLQLFHHSPVFELPGAMVNPVVTKITKEENELINSILLKTRIWLRINL